MLSRLLGRVESRLLLIGTFALLALATTFVVRLLLDDGVRLTDRLLDEIAESVRHDIDSQVTAFLRTPDRVARHVTSALVAGRVSHEDEQAMQTLFRDAIAAHASDAAVSAVYHGSHDGVHIGISAVPDRWPPDDWRFTIASPRTDNRLVHMHIDGRDEIAAPSRVSTLHDPREQPWYRQARAHTEAVWTPVHDGGHRDDSVISRAIALRDGGIGGVLGIDLVLGELQRLVDGLSPGEHGRTLLFGASGEPIGSFAEPSAGEASFAAALDGMEAAFADRVAAGKRFELDGEPGYLLLTPIAAEQGLDWRLGVFVAERDHVDTSFLSWFAPAAPFLLLALAIAAVTAAAATLTMAAVGERVLHPLARLRAGVERIATGEFDVSIDTRGDRDVNRLAAAVVHMRNRLRRSFERLVEQRLIAEVTLESITDGVVTIDDGGRVRYMNGVAERLTGHSLDSAREQEIESVFRTSDEHTGLPMTRQLMRRSMTGAHAIGQAVVLTSADGSSRLVHCRVSPVTDAQGRGYGAVLNFSDLSEEIRLKSELVHQATHDALTDLVNRREFERRTTLALDCARRRGSVHALCYIDLDRFKLINDGAGHNAGDELLRQVAGLLDESVRGGDTVGRLGGDEFGVLLEHCTLEQAGRVLESMRQRVEEFRFHWKGRGYSIGMSAGIVPINSASVSTVAAMRDADSACYIAKSGGPNRLHVHRDDDEELARLRGDQTWMERIEQAIEHDRFSLRAQKIESADINEIHRHVEILLRLIGESGEEFSPAEFLPVAERYGLASRLDRWVVTNTIDWLVSSTGRGELPDLCSINLSGQSLGEPAMLPFIVAEIHRSGVSPEGICFEVTETAAIANLSNALKLIATLRELGCSFALDDFGSGLSSFAYLKTLPVDYLKIDGVFVRDMLDDPLDLAMVRSINEVGQTMGMRTVAEYVENDAVRAALLELGIDFVQGYGVGRPEALDRLMFARQEPPAPPALGIG